ncbi:MAG: hypothetical protein KDA91_00945 [Planctomycetaceae bacterium]|nr:hypothetical protein [Planctomycetaceae bacterium]
MKNSPLLETDSDGDAICQKMSAIRREINRDLSGIVRQAQEVTDWRCLVARAPILSASLSAFAGYLAVPSVGRKDAGPDSGDTHRASAKASGSATPETGPAGTVLRSISSMLIRSVVAHGIQYVASQMASKSGGSYPKQSMHASGRPCRSTGTENND